MESNSWRTQQTRDEVEWPNNFQGRREGMKETKFKGINCIKQSILSGNRMTNLQARCK